MITISTSLIPPTLCYSLTAWGQEYRFAHPSYYNATKADIGMDALNPWGDVETAKDMFWEFVADAVVWPAASLVAGQIIEGARLAGIERAKKLAGHIDLFA